MKYIVGAYVASPCLDQWQPDLEIAYYNGLKKNPNIRGLEHPIYGNLHRDDDEWFLENIDPEWDFVFTCIPGVMNSMQNDPSFGLASNNPEGRARAIAFHARVLTALQKLNARLGRKCVIAVQIHSAPIRRSMIDSSPKAFSQSLQELSSWNWQGAQLVVEHCDAFIPNQHVPEKGFLTLDEEIMAINNSNRDSNSKVGLMVNWARSAIEGRSAETPVEHIQQIRRAGLLRGLIFSGCTDQESEYGVWRDKHMPPTPTIKVIGDRAKGTDATQSTQSTDTIQSESALPKNSLLNDFEIRRCLEAAGLVKHPGYLSCLSYLGAKVMLWPQGASLEMRLKMIRETLDLLKHSSGSQQINMNRPI
jgi:hypothetical protein